MDYYKLAKELYKENHNLGYNEDIKNYLHKIKNLDELKNLLNLDIDNGVCFALYVYAYYFTGLLSCDDFEMICRLITKSNFLIYDKCDHVNKYLNQILNALYILNIPNGTCILMKFYINYCNKLKEDNIKLQIKNQKLQLEIDYSPFGVGYQNAKNHFESLIQEHN